MQKGKCLVTDCDMTNNASELHFSVVAMATVVLVYAIIQGVRTHVVNRFSAIIVPFTPPPHACAGSPKVSQSSQCI